MMAAAVNVDISAWIATRTRFITFCVVRECFVFCFDICEKGAVYLPLWPVVGIGFSHVRDGIEIICSMAVKKILSVLG